MYVSSFLFFRMQVRVFVDVSDCGCVCMLVCDGCGEYNDAMIWLVSVSEHLKSALQVREKRSDDERKLSMPTRLTPPSWFGSYYSAFRISFVFRVFFLVIIIYYNYARK